VKLRSLAPAFAVLCIGTASAQVLAPQYPGGYKPQFDEDKPWEEQKWALPEYPADANLVRFYVSPTTPFEFFVDSKSVSVGKDGVVRYTLVARSPSGVDTVNYEGLRCATSEHRIYAFGRPGGSWSMSTVPWREISPSNAQRWQFTLQKDFFCLHGKSIRSASEGIAALEKGGHPWVKSLDGSWNSGTR